MIRKFARPMLSSVFIYDGVDALKNSAERAPRSKEILNKVKGLLPAPYKSYIPEDTEICSKVRLYL